jgi:hypothetical protein
MSLNEAERTSHLARLDPEVIDEIAVRISDAVVSLVTEMLRVRGLRSPLGDPLHHVDGNDAARATAPGSAGALRPTARRPGEDSGALWTAREVAARYRVTATFVYGHANELGCIRLGAGPCARLRFDPRVVRERWSTVGELPEPRPKTRNRAGPQRRSGSSNRGYELLEYDREP